MFHVTCHWELKGHFCHPREERRCLNESLPCHLNISPELKQFQSLHQTRLTQNAQLTKNEALSFSIYTAESNPQLFCKQPMIHCRNTRIKDVISCSYGSSAMYAHNLLTNFFDFDCFLNVTTHTSFATLHIFHPGHCKNWKRFSNTSI